MLNRHENLRGKLQTHILNGTKEKNLFPPINKSVEIRENLEKKKNMTLTTLKNSYWPPAFWMHLKPCQDES